MEKEMLEKSLFYCPEEFENGRKAEVLDAVKSLQNFPLELNDLRKSYLNFLLPEVEDYFT
jgi:hypothetical protein